MQVRLLLEAALVEAGEDRGVGPEVEELVVVVIFFFLRKRKRSKRRERKLSEWIASISVESGAFRLVVFILRQRSQ